MNRSAQTSLLFGGVSLLTASVAPLGNQSASLEWLHSLSPYFWAFGDNPLSSGASMATIVVFYATSVVLAALAALALRQRDIGV